MLARVRFFTVRCDPEFTVGRDTGGIFAGDSYLSPKHAIFRQKSPGKLSVEDAIIRHPGKLGIEERIKIMRHPRCGAEWLNDQRELGMGLPADQAVLLGDLSGRIGRVGPRGSLPRDPQGVEPRRVRHGLGLQRQKARVAVEFRE